MWGQNAQRFCNIATSMLVAMGLSSLQAQASPLTSQFLVSDAAATAVMAGTPYEMADPNWLAAGKYNRSIFAYKIYSALLMLGYQTEPYQNGPVQVGVLKMFQTNNPCGNPASSLLDAACLSVIDQQLAQREPLLASLAAGFPLYGHMQPLVANDISRDTLAATYWLPMTVLPAMLQMNFYETLQCLGGQCNGFIHDVNGNTISSWPTPIDPASNAYYFVGAYYDRFVDNSQMPSAAVSADTVLHEFGHYIDGYIPWSKDPLLPHLGVIDTTSFNNITFDLSDPGNHRPNCLKRRTENPYDWLAKYGFTNYSGAYCAAGYSTTVENWAEAFAMYVTAGRDFRAAANQSNYIAQEYDWIKTHVFNGLEFDTDLPQASNSGCNDVSGLQWALPGYMHCNGNYVWNFTLPHGTVNGVCGSAKDGTFVNAPGSNLCTSGAASVVGNTGNWTWTCRGLNGGSTDNCSATILTGNAPDSPTVVTAIAGNMIANVSFLSPGNAGSAAIDGYTVTSIPASGVDSNAGATALNHTLTGLTNDTPYTFTVTAHNTFGNSAPSVPSAAVIPTWSLVSENFDSIAAPDLPANWNSWKQIGAAGAWATSSASNFPPNVSAHIGSNLVLFNSQSAGINQSARLAPPPFSLAGISGAKASFWMYRDNDSTANDYLDVFASLSPGTWNPVLSSYQENGSEVAMGYRIYRYRGWSPIVLVAGWNHYVFDLPASVVGNSTVYVFFRGYSAGSGVNILLDDIVVALPPGAPTVTSVNAGNGQATVTFSAPLNNGGSAVAGYTVSSIPAGGTDTNAGSTSLTHTVTGLTNGTSYSFTVTASNAVANSAPSSQSGSVTPVTVPSAPQSPVATARSKRATVTFTAPASNGGSAITGYTVTSTPAGGVDMHADTLNLSHTVIGLTNGADYTFAVTATSDVGMGAASATSNTVTPVLDSTSLVVSASPSPSVYGQSVTFTATVSGTALNGTVEFYEGASSLWPAMNLTSSQARFADTPSVGSHSITASYSGDSTNAPSTSPAVSLQVNKADVVTTLTSHLPDPSYPLRPVAVNASVVAKAPGVGFPTGTMTVSDGTSSCQFAVSSASGCELIPTSAGTKSLVASYGGDASFNAGDSVAVTHTVSAPVLADKPTIAAVVPRTNAAVVAFVPPLSDGGSNISGYAASCAPAGGAAHSAQGLTSPLLVSGLVNGVTHSCHVTATNTAGTSAASDPVLVTPGLPVPQLSIASHAPNPSAFGASFPVTVSIGPTVPAVAMVGGGDHTCLLDTGGNLRCWGRNNLGQLGDGTRINRPVPVVVPGLPAGVTAVAGGLAHTCAIVSTNVWCWGDNSGGQIGSDPTTVPWSSVARQVSGLTGVVAVTAGRNFSCALNVAGKVYCWGDNGSGALGNGQNSNGDPTPMPTPGLVDFSGVSVTSGIAAIGAGWGHACAIDNAGKVYCWGANNIGQLGNNTSVLAVAPVAVVMPEGFAGAVSIGGGLEHSCALTATGTVWCWGGNGYDELGNGGTLGSSPVPINTTGFASDVAALSVGLLDNCAVDSSGIVYCWGTGWFEVAGTGNANPSLPVAVSTAANDFVAVATGNSHTCAQARNGSVTCWGNNDFSQLGDTTLVSRTALGHVSGYANPTGVIDVGDTQSVCHISLPVTNCNLTPGTPGVKALTATYAGDVSYGSATSSSVAHTVSPAIGQLTLGTSVNPSFVGQTVTLTATASGSSPAGVVTFNDSAVTVCNAVPMTNGQAQCATSSLGAGNHNLAATYSGDSSNTGATSNVLVQAVASPGSASSTTTLVASPVGSSVSGKMVTLTAQVSGAGSAPTGFVDFRDGATALASLAVSGQPVTFITNALTAGSHSLSANYSGNATYQASAGSLSYSVLALINTTLVVSTAPNPSQPGQSVTVTTSVSGSPPGGTVSVSGGGQNCTITLPATACTFIFPTKGAKRLTATYNGYGAHVGSSGSKTHYVGKKSDITPILMLLLD